MAREVSFAKKINDNGSAKRVTADAEELGRVIRARRTRVNGRRVTF